MFLLRIKKLLTVLFSAIIALTFIGCSSASNSNNDDDEGSSNKTQTVIKENASRITFLDVGNGECTFIRFSDGKTMLIDCGEKRETVTEKLGNILTKECKGELDFFIYTHPDFEHTGNAEYVLQNADIGTIYMPELNQPNDKLFPEYLTVKALAESKGVTIINPDMYKSIKGEGYFVAFLTPDPFSGSYDRFNKSVSPTMSDVNNLSPIVYMDINGVRFLFTGDAEKDEEKVVCEFYQIGFYENLYANTSVNVKLENINYLQVAGSGFNQGSSQEFLDLIKAKTAVISVSGNNYNGYPTSTVLKRLQNANENYRIVRTDVVGTFNVYVNPEGKIIENTGD